MFMGLRLEKYRRGESRHWGFVVEVKSDSFSLSTRQRGMMARGMRLGFKGLIARVKLREDYRVELEFEVVGEGNSYAGMALLPATSSLKADKHIFASPSRQSGDSFPAEFSLSHKELKSHHGHALSFNSPLFISNRSFFSNSS